MSIRLKYVVTILLIMVILGACNNRPKVIEPSVEEDQKTLESATKTQLHAVLVTEVLPASRYTYAKVREDDTEFWIATGKMEIKVEETYYYRGGLRRTDFESKEHNRIFDEIYLVSNLVSKAAHTTVAKAGSRDRIDLAEEGVPKKDIPTHSEKGITHKGLVTIAELVRNPKMYEGHSVEISGTCTKVNTGIMGRNWLHLKDGSKDDYDLVVTSNAIVPAGTEISLRALVVLNRDFGAGYSYDVLLENGIVVE
ncbi:MAG: GW dipeptide domain-containing protein [Bacteroidota bacterium]